MMNIYFKDDCATPLSHYWQNCVGSCEACTALRADFQQQLTKCKNELSFRYIRFHGLFNDQMSVCLKRKGQITYHFHNIDLVYDFLLSIDMKPFVELSFMPKLLASGTQTIFHYEANVTPPMDYGQWFDLVQAFTRHITERYGQHEVASWYFEVWNEPNLPDFWTGGMSEYFKLYQSSVKAVKSVCPHYRVGGPATAKNAWIPELIAYCANNGLPLDFITTHHYPTDCALAQDEATHSLYSGIQRNSLTSMARIARQQSGSLPLHYTEWNTSPDCTDSLHDEPYNAAFIAKTLLDNHGLVESYSYWTFSDIFEEFGQSSEPFHGGFGLLTLHGIKKPSYQAYKLLNMLGKWLLPVQIEPQNTTVDCYATKTESGFSVMLCNHNVPFAEIYEEAVKITIGGIQSIQTVTAYIIDSNNCNPKGEWEKMGSPLMLEAGQLAALKQAAELKPCWIEPEYTNEQWSINLVCKPHSVTLLQICCQTDFTGQA